MFVAGRNEDRRRHNAMWLCRSMWLAEIESEAARIESVVVV